MAKPGAPKGNDNADKGRYDRKQEEQNANRREQAGLPREKVELTPDEDLPDY